MKKKPSMAVMIGLGRSRPPSDDDESAEDLPDDEMDEGEDYSDERSRFAQDLLDAVKDGDAAGVADALEQFVRACGRG